MIQLPYSLVIEATNDPDFFGFFSPDLEGFTGIGHSIEDCIYQARWGMQDHVQMLRDQKLPVPPVNTNPTITVQNDRKLQAA
jgi:predicted RNase H-like HicB family nuclease